MGRRVISPLRWLLPGLGIKRWLVLVVIGAALLVDGIYRWLVAEGGGLHINEGIDAFVDDYFSPSYLTWMFIIAGLLAIVYGLSRWTKSMTRTPRMGDHGLLDSLLVRRLDQGYKVVAIGGGTGLSTLLRGLKRRTTNLTAIVTVSDDGGSSGRLQKELGVLPPGDVRNCLVALADDEALVTDLFRYRFEESGSLTGHSFGNLFLAAMSGITGNFDAAIKESSRVLNIVGRVLPTTLSVVQLCAELDDGTIVAGESNIPKTRQAIRTADDIVLGPGSLFTSILPNFLVERITYEVAHSNAVKIYVCNVMTQPGETDHMTAADHVEALFRNAGARVCDYVIVNDEPPHKLLITYAEERQEPVIPDIERIEALGLVPIRAQMISENLTVRHNPEKLADQVLEVIDRAVAERATFVKPASAYAKASSAAALRR
jgi:2-phospho-L-lactate transferase/gluconeogenesis factor (CofD/UPF0052 family)